MSRLHLAMMAVGAFAVGGIPAFTRQANSVVRHVPFRDYSRFKSCHSDHHFQNPPRPGCSVSRSDTRGRA